MDLLDNLNEAFDVTRVVITGTGVSNRSSGVSGSASGDEAATANLRDLQQIIENRKAELLLWRGTLYFPPGRYRVACDLGVLSSWNSNLFQQAQQARLPTSQSLPPEYRTTFDARSANHFGASLFFPEGLTLWLAPGAVLVPDAGCIIDISCVLVAERTQIFDLSRGGLVVFGNRVPVVRPEWWTSPPDAVPPDPVHPIQRAIDAAIHNRAIRWNYPVAVAGHSEWFDSPQPNSRDPLTVEIRGQYDLAQTIGVHGGRTSNDLTRILGQGHPDRFAILGSDTWTVIRGAWSGRSRQGATLAATATLRGPLLTLRSCPGLTLRDLAFVTRGGELEYHPCVELLIFEDEEVPNRLVPLTRHAAAQLTGLRGCRFEGTSTPLVQVGEPVTGITSADYLTGVNPTANPVFTESDFSLLAFDECEFRPDGGVALDFGASQSLPVRFRRCEFIGSASTMLSLWDGAHFLDGCYFENSLPVAESRDEPFNSLQRGFEAPDGTDIFLRLRYPATQGAGAYPTSELPNLTALGCVSRSDRFLSTSWPGRHIIQDPIKPVMLLNLRHIPTRPSPSSVIWGLSYRQDDYILVGSETDLRSRPVGSGGQLVIVGGQFGGSIRILDGASQSVVIGERVQGSAFPLFIDVASGLGMVVAHHVRSPLPFTMVFGLPDDQRQLTSWG